MTVEIHEILPPLREELAIHPGPQHWDGSPTWTIHDPTGHRFFRIGWQEFEVLSRWSLATAERIAAAIAAETTWQADAVAVQRLIDRLRNAHLLVPISPGDRQRHLYRQRQQQTGWLRWLLHHYLFLRIPLVHPDEFLQRTLPLVRWMFNGWFVGALVITALSGGLMILHRWEEFVGSFPFFFSLSGMLAYSGAIVLSKVVHELGHAWTARHYGCRVPVMGVVLMVLWPVCYTDTHEVWKLPSRRQRLVVGAAGMMAEITLAACASLAWGFLPDGPWRSAAFLLASSIWIFTLAVNLNPFLRFDGYFLLSDGLEMGDLHPRAFRLGRWYLREFLFGLGAAPPESLGPGWCRLLIGYAFLTWCYRFILFFGIALLVYEKFFKVLGLFLFAVEIGWFLLRPVLAEFRAWVLLSPQFRFSFPMLRTLTLLLAVVAVITLPWRITAVTMASVLQAGGQTVVFSPVPSRIDQILVEPDQRVSRGDFLLTLEDPDLSYRRDRVERSMALLRWQLTQPATDDDPLVSEPVLQQELARSQAEWQALQREQQQLHVVAPVDGTVVDMANDLTPGQWLAKDEPLLTIISNEYPLVKGYVAERDRIRIVTGGVGRFYPDNSDEPPLSGRIIRIDQTPTHYLPTPWLASLYGGEIPVRQLKDGRLVVEGSYYRVDLELDSNRSVNQMSRGVTVIQSASESLAFRWWRLASDILRRQMGF
ncbi:MAG: HlyD family efflux transporter periplasmic adaptor subunit [Magnetococcales bacterium]|nr:HlyD family efflux transporter periplasmic adaptor subunit [Magnetococcales bacterium]